LDPVQYSQAVAYTLWEGAWQKASYGSHLAYLRSTVMQRVHLAIDDRVLHPDSADIMLPKEGRPYVESLDQPVFGQPTDDPLLAFIGGQEDEGFLDVENRLALQQLLDRSDLPPGTVEYTRARYEHDITREHAHDATSLSPQQVNAAHRALQRRRARLKNEFSA